MLQYTTTHLGWLRGQRAGPRAASVGDEELDPVRERGGGRVQRLGGLGSRQVQRHHLRQRAVLLLEGRCEVGERCGAARHEHDVAAAPGGFGGEGVADAAGRAGDDGPRPVGARGSERKAW